MSILVRDIGTLVSGDVSRPIIEADSIFIEDGVIQQVGGPPRSAQTVIDVKGTTVTPGLWDAHHHPYFGEYSPRIDAHNLMSRTVKAGTTSLVSAGPAHQPGMYLPSETLPNVQSHLFRRGSEVPQARDAVGSKALAIVSAKCWAFDRPLGIKCYAGTVIAEPGLKKADFEEMYRAGVQRLKFLRPIPFVEEAKNYCAWAHEYGMVVMTHTGGRLLISETESIGESLRVIRPDVASHVNGGPTPPPLEDVHWLIEETPAFLDVVVIGNMKVACRVLELANNRNELHRVIIGTDMPSNMGVMPGGVMRMVSLLSSMIDLSPEQLLCMATGNTARAFRLPGGLIEPGQPADLVVWDPADGSVTKDLLECISYGDKPSPALVIIDGVIRVHGNPLAVDAKRMPTVTSH